MKRLTSCVMSTSRASGEIVPLSLSQARGSTGQTFVLSVRLTGAMTIGKLTMGGRAARRDAFHFTVSRSMYVLGRSSVSGSTTGSVRTADRSNRAMLSTQSDRQAMYVQNASGWSGA